MSVKDHVCLGGVAARNLIYFNVLSLCYARSYAAEVSLRVGSLENYMCFQLGQTTAAHPAASSGA